MQRHPRNVEEALPVVMSAQTVKNWIDEGVREYQFQRYILHYWRHRALEPRHYCGSLQKESNHPSIKGSLVEAIVTVIAIN